MPLTARVEAAGGATSLNDLAARVSAREERGGAVFEAIGQLQTIAHQKPAGGPAEYRLSYRLEQTGVAIEARSEAGGRLVLPVVCTREQRVHRVDERTLRFERDGGRLLVSCEAPARFDPVPDRRVFNLVPGFQCAPVACALEPGRDVRVVIRTVD